MKSEPPITCTFCGKSLVEVRRMVHQNEKACICDQCVTLCQELIDEEDREEQMVAQRLEHQPTSIRPIL